MRGLTVRQPYAQAIACGRKRIETRGQRTRYRGRLAIHAALGHALPLALADLDGVLAEYPAAGLDIEAIEASLEPPESWSFGKIIAVAELVDCRPAEDLTPDPVERAFGDYAVRRFGRQFAHVVRLPVPVPARGLQGLWPVRPETMDLLEQALSTLRRHDSR